MKKVAILQSNYIPWKGYFDLIASVDEFIIYDSVQFTRRDWRNRNVIKTPQGLQWVTVPVVVKGRYDQLVKDTQIDGANWAPDHWKSLCLNYKKAPYFNELANFLEPLYLDRKYTHISQLNRVFIDFICHFLGIRTRISNSWDYEHTGERSDRLVKLCKAVGGTTYVSGPAAKGYIEKDVFSRAGLELSWFDYNGYIEYQQQWGKFVHEVSILDLLFNCGKRSSRYLRYANVYI